MLGRESKILKMRIKNVKVIRVMKIKVVMQHIHWQWHRQTWDTEPRNHMESCCKLADLTWLHQNESVRCNSRCGELMEEISPFIGSLLEGRGFPHRLGQIGWSEVGKGFSSWPRDERLITSWNYRFFLWEESKVGCTHVQMAPLEPSDPCFEGRCWIGTWPPSMCMLSIQMLSGKITFLLVFEKLV